jgi:hypothetical protein
MAKGSKTLARARWLIGVSCIAFLALGLYRIINIKSGVDAVDAIEHAITAFAVVVGSGWTLYLFVLRRAYETALSIDYIYYTQPLGVDFIVFFEVILTNTATRRIAAPGRLTPEQQKHFEASIEYPGDLQLKRLSKHVAASAFLGWWTEGQLDEIEGIPAHIPLLYEYSLPDNSIEFFMEAGEKYVLGTAFVLSGGDYSAKMVFVGSREHAAEYWSRIAYFRVPKPTSSEESKVGPATSVR